MHLQKSYVKIDEYGVMRVGESRVMLDSVVTAFEQGHSAETIQQQYPALSLEEVYGAIAGYLANLGEIAQYLERQDAVWEQWRAKAAERPSPVVQRLRAHQQRHVPEPWRIAPTRRFWNTLVNTVEFWSLMM
jgi:uncharacterized protein (DUF433 family)